jgi:hypothetical protein
MFNQTQPPVSSAQGPCQTTSIAAPRGDPSATTPAPTPKRRNQNIANGIEARREERRLIKAVADRLPQERYGETIKSPNGPHKINMKKVLRCVLEEFDLLNDIIADVQGEKAALKETNKQLYNYIEYLMVELLKEKATDCDNNMVP